MTTEKFIFKCDMCEASYQHGPHRFEGHSLPLYGKIFACNQCWNGNHDGWAPDLEARLHAHLTRQGLPVPQRNDKGWLPRG